MAFADIQDNNNDVVEEGEEEAGEEDEANPTSPQTTNGAGTSLPLLLNAQGNEL